MYNILRTGTFNSDKLIFSKGILEVTCFSNILMEMVFVFAYGVVV